MGSSGDLPVIRAVREDGNMNLAEALNVLANREWYEENFGLKNPRFWQRNKRQVSVRFDHTTEFQTLRELIAYCEALQRQRITKDTAAVVE